MARIAVNSNGDNPPDANSLPNPPRFNVELPPISCFIEDKNGSPTRKFFTTPDELTNHLERTTHHKERKLYVLEGLPIEYVQVLGLHFNIDVDIFDSHAMRKSGQLNKLEFPTKIGNEKKVRTFALDHPEITTNITPPPEASGGVAGDFMIPCKTIDISDESWNGISVKLCHVTLVCFPGENGSETCEIKLSFYSEHILMVAMQSTIASRKPVVGEKRRPISNCGLPQYSCKCPQKSSRGKAEMETIPKT